MKPVSAGPTTYLSSRSGKICAAVFACLAAFGLDALLFRSGLYTSILDPDSSTGQFELILRREQKAQAGGARNLVATVGNSRMAFSPKTLDRQGLSKQYELRAAGIAGSNARVWYYMLRDLDPTRRRYRAVVIALDDYDDEDRAGDPADDIAELHYVIARLRLSDVWTFAHSFDDPKLVRQALRDTILKGLVFQQDVRAFLADPLHRFEYVELCDQGYAGWTYDFLETTKNLAGLRIDWSNLEVTFPPGTDDEQRATVKSFLAHTPDLQTGRLAAYRRLWLGRIVDLYQGSDTKIILLRLPRGPIPRPDSLAVKSKGATRQLARRPNVLLADEHAFDSVEHPEFFKDGMHLNREGIDRFSVLLEKEVARLLGPPDRNVAVK